MIEKEITAKLIILNNGKQFIRYLNSDNNLDIIIPFIFSEFCKKEENDISFYDDIYNFELTKTRQYLSANSAV